VKLSVKGDGAELQCVWAGPGLLAAANAEPMIRLWDLEQDSNYILAITPGKMACLLYIKTNTCVCFCICVHI